MLWWQRKAVKKEFPRSPGWSFYLPHVHVTCVKIQEQAWATYLFNAMLLFPYGSYFSYNINNNEK